MKIEPLSDRMEKGNNEKVALVQLPGLSVKYCSPKKRNSYSFCSKAETFCYSLWQTVLFYQPLLSVLN